MVMAKRQNMEGQMVQVQELFEDELARRNIAWSIDAESGRYVIAYGDECLYVSLENLARDVAKMLESWDVIRVHQLAAAIA